MTFLSNWCRAEITEIQDLTYGVIPKLLPFEAIKELFSKPTEQTEKQQAMVLNSIPPDWLQVLKAEIAKPDENFSIKLSPDTKPKTKASSAEYSASRRFSRIFKMKQISLQAGCQERFKAKLTV